MKSYDEFLLNMIFAMLVGIYMRLGGFSELTKELRYQREFRRLKSVGMSDEYASKEAQRKIY